MKVPWRRNHGLLRIGIVTTDDRRRGLWRDTECLLWALGNRRDGAPPVEVSLFPIPERDTIEKDPALAVASRSPLRRGAHARAGTRYAEWLGELHALVCCEYMMPRAFAMARERGVHVAYVPNLDWAVLDGRSDDTEAWLAAVRGADVQVWAKTPAVGRRLGEVGIASQHVPWSIPDAVERARRARRADGCVRFVMNAGNGGYRNRRGADIAVEAFRIARAQNPALALTVKTIRPLGRALRAAGPGEGVTLIEGFHRRRQIAALYRAHDCALHPSRWEGFGLALLEALHAGTPVIGTDGWPMNELFAAEKSGIAVPARLAGSCRLAPWWECDPGELAAAMLRFAGDGALAARMACADSGRLEERQRAFVDTVRRLLAGGTSR